MTMLRMESRFSLWLFRHGETGPECLRMPKTEDDGSGRNGSNPPPDHEWMKFRHAFEVSNCGRALSLVGAVHHTSAAIHDHELEEILREFPPTPKGD